ncbi:hypothetical protein QTP70_004495 [Hemibagrus guttatus]|uniref:Reverse transcriptase domain-containing protein n=1 Tax=Hemibagrus guttatus TaxID=175788 RepID=A0AAE0RA72_9TELE|nr:hypothetical protein QTP70_004495 [Hemibagrus guttatus]
MTGKGRELADMMERRKVDILCVQETRWKGSKARSIGAGFKLFYYGVDSKRNGVGVVLKEEFGRNVLEVKRVSDKVMSLKLEIEGVMLNIVSGYAPQVGCELVKKERFWSELDEVMESIPTGERVVIGADFNGHVGEGNTGDEEVMGKFGVKERNLEGQMVVDFAKRMDMAVVNTYFQKREEHRVTYKTGGMSTQVDYILCRRGNLKEISDCKVVVGESVTRQHRMVVCRMTLMVCKKKRLKIEIEKKTKWWKLKKEECCEEFRQSVKLLKFADDTTLIGLISDGNESAYRGEIDRLVSWCSTNNLELNSLKTVEMTVDFRKDPAPRPPVILCDSPVSSAESFCFLGTTITKELKWAQNISSLTKKAQQRMYFLRQLKKFLLPVKMLVNFYTAIIESVLTSSITVWFAAATARDKAKLQRVIHSAEKVIGCSLPSLQELYFSRSRRCAAKIAADPSHPNLEKVYDRVPREELWYCMRKSGVAEKYVRVVQDMYERSRTVVRCAVGQTEEFKVEVGLHQGLALSPFLLAMVMDQFESREQVEENLERWRFVLERRGMKVSRSKTEYMCVNEREGSGTVRLQGEEVKKVQEFKYLGSTVQSNGECGKEVKKRVQASWNGWRKVSGVLCDKKISARIKGKVYRTVVRPAMLYGLETVSLRKEQESELEVAELKMLRFSLGMTRFVPVYAIGRPLLLKQYHTSVNGALPKSHLSSSFTHREDGRSGKNAKVKKPSEARND